MRVSHKVMKETFTAFKEGQREMTATIRHSRVKSNKNTATVKWMRTKFNLIGDKMPHLDQVIHSCDLHDSSKLYCVYTIMHIKRNKNFLQNCKDVGLA